MIVAQVFTPSSSLEGVALGSVAFADVDGDGDQDVLVTGVKNQLSPTEIAVLYKNDGKGNFSEFEDTPFTGVNFSAVAFADVDGDGDQDVLITGQNGGLKLLTKLYLNGGEGDFTEQENAPFDGVKDGDVAFSDVDGDSDYDVLITGRNNSGVRTAKLYLNNGKGIYSEAEEVSFDGVFEGELAFADVDSDGDQDVVITGLNRELSKYPITKLYKNDGQGNFSENRGPSLHGGGDGSVAFSDVDGDGDQDLLLTGKDSYRNPITKLYFNDGQGKFIEKKDINLVKMYATSVDFADVDGDGSQDLLLTGTAKKSGEKVGGVATSKLYLNNGKGEFTEILDTPFTGVSRGDSAFSDIDGDGDLDILITGWYDRGEKNHAVLSQWNKIGELSFDT